jgi:hypothetical protein
MHQEADRTASPTHYPSNPSLLVADRRPAAALVCAKKVYRAGGVEVRAPCCAGLERLSAGSDPARAREVRWTWPVAR